jgi:hypothetical protein
LHGPVLWQGILLGPDPCLYILLAPHLCSGIFHDLCSGIFHGPDLCPRILHRLDLSVLLHGPDLCSGILHSRCLGVLDLCLGILYGLYGRDLCPCIFLGRPSLKLLQQGFGWRLTDFGLTLIGRLKSGSNFVARLSIGRPSLELLEQGFGWGLRDFGLALIGSFKSGRIPYCCRNGESGHPERS